MKIYCALHSGHLMRRTSSFRLLDAVKIPPTPINQIPALEVFRTLSLSDMLTQLPCLQIGNSEFSHKVMMPQIKCVDGTTLSVQASELHYAEPRKNKGPYRAVEVGFPSVTPPDTWRPYAEEWEHGDGAEGTGTVYAYIPIELVSFFIAAHGGIDREKTFDGFEFRLR